MTAERNEKEDKAMANANIRTAHKLLNELFNVSELCKWQMDLIRGLMPELPEQKTLEEITGHVYDAWLGADGNEWGGNEDDPDIAIEAWLAELHAQLEGLTPAEPAHPEFLETEADYRDAPEGTIVAHAKNLPCHKYRSEWASVGFFAVKDDRGMSRTRRRVLRWGWGNE